MATRELEYPAFMDESEAGTLTGFEGVKCPDCCRAALARVMLAQAGY